jgi:hypothetical protein
MPDGSYFFKYLKLNTFPGSPSGFYYDALPSNSISSIEFSTREPGLPSVHLSRASSGPGLGLRPNIEARELATQVYD